MTHTRNRPAKLVTLDPETWTKLDEMAARRGSSRSAEVERAVRAVKMPKDRRSSGLTRCGRCHLPTVKQKDGIVVPEGPRCACREIAET